MKWLKLDCDFRNDPKILSLSQRFGGQQACSFWTLLLAYVGSNGMPNCEIHVTPTGPHSINLIASFLHTKPKVALTMLSACAQVRLISPERWDNDTVIYIPNMLKRVDDYTRKVRTLSKQSPKIPTVDTDTEQIQSRHRTEIEQNPAENRRVDEMSKLSPSALSDFDVFWAGSTKRGSKKDALAAWRQITFTERQSGVIEIGMAAWKQSAQWQDETKQPHICRWLKRRGWEELVPKGNRNGDGINEESKAEKRGRAIIEQTRRINQRILGQDSAGNGSDYDPREDSALYLGIDPAD